MEDHIHLLSGDGFHPATNDLSSRATQKAFPAARESDACFCFQLTADYDVAICWEKDFLTAFDKDALQSIAKSPIAMSRMARIAMQLDMAQSNSSSLNACFAEPPREMILACLKDCLSEDQWREWEALKELPMDEEFESLMRVVLAFVVTLRSASYAQVIPAQ